MDTPKIWGEMSREEKGALLLAAHDGKVIEVHHPARGSGWHNVDGDPAWNHYASYRVKPEPVRETVAQDYTVRSDGLWASTNPTHRIIFDTIDGEPLCESIRMEKL